MFQESTQNADFILKYLGTLITEHGNPAQEIRRRITATMAVFQT